MCPLPHQHDDVSFMKGEEVRVGRKDGAGSTVVMGLLVGGAAEDVGCVVVGLGLESVEGPG